MVADLYIATRSDRPDIVKVGRSANVKRRCLELSASQCFRVQPAHVYPGCGDCEREVHEMLRPHQVSGGSGKEWFNIPASEAAKIVDTILPGRRRMQEPQRSVHSDTWTELSPTRLVYNSKTGRHHVKWVYCR